MARGLLSIGVGWICRPLSPHLQAPGTGPKGQKGRKLKPKAIFRRAMEQHQSSMNPGSRKGNGQAPRRILVVDDQPFFLAMVRNLLAPEGLEVETASSGAAGLKVALATRPDVIVLDVEMPGMDGFETCQWLKANPDTAGIPVVFFTATSDPKLHERAFEAGAEAVYQKATSADQLRRMLCILTDGARPAARRAESGVRSQNG